MRDILARLLGSRPNESSHELYCRCLDAAREIERLREGNAPAIPPCECGNEGCDGQRYRPPYSRVSQPCPRQSPSTMSPCSSASHIALTPQASANWAVNSDPVASLPSRYWTPCWVMAFRSLSASPA